MSGDVIARMWEVRAEPGRLAELVSWVCDTGLPEVEHSPLHIASEVFSSTEDRVVVVSKWRGEPRSMPDPPLRLVARPPYSWDFVQVDR